MKALIPLLILALGMQATAYAQVPQYARTTHLNAWYSFDGNAEDATGNNQDLQVLGATLTTDRHGNANSAYEFDGVATYLRRADFIHSGAKRIAISFWYKRSVATVQGTMIAYGEDQADEPNTWHTRATISDVYGSPVDGGGSLHQTYGGDNGTADWHHVIFVRVGDDFYLYLNGVLQTGQPNGVGWAGDLNLFIGCKPDQTDFFAGKIDDVGFWQDHEPVFSYCDALRLLRAYTYEQPVNQTANAGASATFATTPSNFMTFQWQADAGTGFQDLTDAGQYSGSTAAALTVSNIDQTNHNTVYRCIIDNGACTNITDEATLTITTGGGTGIIDRVADDLAMQVFPNPATDHIQVEASLKTSGKLLTEIRSTTGKLVYSATENAPAGKYQDYITLDFPGGVYFVTLKTDKGLCVKRIQVVK